MCYVPVSVVESESTRRNNSNIFYLLQENDMMSIVNAENS